jgi:arginase
MATMLRRTGWFGLIGAPTDVGHTGCGATEGPGAMRDAGLMRRLGRVALVADLGDVAGPAYDGSAGADGSRNLRQTADWCRAVRDRAARVLATGGTPLLLGGDHAMALGSVAASAAHAARLGRPLHLLWIDAHADFNTPQTSPSGNTHGLPAASICGLGPSELLDIGAFIPLVSPSRLTQIGVRDIDPGEALNLARAGVQPLGMATIGQHGIIPLLTDLLRRVQADHGLLHVSFDLDVLDPHLAPGVGSPVPDGLDATSAQAALRVLGDSGLVTAFDLVELAPRHDQQGQTLDLSIGLLCAFLQGERRETAVPGVAA